MNSPAVYTNNAEHKVHMVYSSGAVRGSGHVTSRFSSWQCGLICLKRLSARVWDIPAGFSTGGNVV